MPSPRPLVIIHGWSDTSESFQHLAELIAARRGQPPQVIALGDYISMSDHVTFDDIVAALDEAWGRTGLPRSPRSVDAIVHSTGGLVIRDWMSRPSFAGKPPISNLVMLAPANFGSPLAHKGRSFLGRVFKGFGNDEGAFQTGTHILKGLELASPYSWNLALRDRFDTQNRIFGKGRVLCTVLVGNTGYSGIRAMANEDGGDGTVRVSTANLNPVLIDVDFSKDPFKPSRNVTEPAGKAAFAIVDGHDHASIVLPRGIAPSRSVRPLQLIMEALEVDDAGFEDWCDKLDRSNTRIMKDGETKDATRVYQNTVVRVIDQDDNPVSDYILEFYADDDDRDIFARIFHKDALWGVHVYGDDPSYRSLYVNCDRVRTAIDKPGEKARMSLTASPQVGIDAPVGFKTFADNDIGSVQIGADELPLYFQPNRTVLMTVRIRRHREAEVFTMTPAGA